MLSVVLLAISLSLDSLSVGLTYGTRGLRVGLAARLILGLASMSLSALALGLGQVAAGLVPAGLSRWTGALVLVALGAALAWRGLWSQPADGDPSPTALEIRLRSLGLVIQILREPVSADVDRSGEITPTESLALGLALAADSAGAGFGAALSGYQSWLLPPAVGLACTLLFALGHQLGARSPWRFTGRAAVLPGVFLIALGLLRLL